jgi:hypothetical protein
MVKAYTGAPERSHRKDGVLKPRPVTHTSQLGQKR